MRFAILMTDIEGEWDALSPSRQKEILDQHAEFRQALSAAGKLVDVLHFYPRSEARTVRRAHDGAIVVSNGPFSDAREYVGGLYVIEAESIDEAAGWAARGRLMPGANEVRRIHG